MSQTHFKVFSGRPVFNGAFEATVTINRSNNLVIVRPKRRRKTYEMRLEDLAESIVWRCIKAEIAQKKAEKKAKRLVRRAA